LPQLTTGTDKAGSAAKMLRRTMSQKEHSSTDRMGVMLASLGLLGSPSHVGTGRPLGPDRRRDDGSDRRIPAVETRDAYDTLPLAGATL
jgi:hypothetical protein